jgi:hypothetical protein
MESSKQPPQQPDATLPLFPTYYFASFYIVRHFLIFQTKLLGCIVAVVFRNLCAYTHTAVHNEKEKHMHTITGWWGLVHAVNCAQTVFKNSKYK